MRYPTPQFIYAAYSTLKSAYSRRGEGRTFFPFRSYRDVFDRLDAACSRARTEYEGVALYDTIFEKAAAIGHAISRNHVFGNGNKRTAFMTMTQVLMVNGWHLTMPPEIVAAMMIRTATHKNTLSVKDMAVLLGSFSHYHSDDLVLKRLSDRLLELGSLIVIDDDIYPAEEPKESPSEYAEQAKKILKQQFDLMDEDEANLFGETFRWPVQMRKRMDSWIHVQEHKKRSDHKRRLRTKRCGKRRLPHKGGRTVPKICRPIRHHKRRK